MQTSFLFLKDEESRKMLIQFVGNNDLSRNKNPLTIIYLSMYELINRIKI
jgi:hypothetical protein